MVHAAGIPELQGGSLYVMGDFCSWQYTADNRMFWNAAKGCYEASLLLKQGWYNYEFAFLPDGASVSEGFHFEGSHWETENDYLVFTYFRDPTTRYDRLTGITWQIPEAGRQSTGNSVDDLCGACVMCSYSDYCLTDDGYFLLPCVSIP